LWYERNRNNKRNLPLQVTSKGAKWSFDVSYAFYIVFFLRRTRLPIFWVFICKGRIFHLPIDFVHPFRSKGQFLLFLFFYLYFFSFRFFKILGELKHEIKHLAIFDRHSFNKGKKTQKKSKFWSVLANWTSCSIGLWN